MRATAEEERNWRYMDAAKFLSQISVQRAQIRWLRKMLRRAYTCIATDLGDEVFVDKWFADYLKEMK